MVENNVVSAVAYYQAMSEKNLSEVAKYLHPNVKFNSPLAQLIGKEAVLDAIKKLTTFFKTLKIRAQFGSGDQAIIVYDIHFPAPLGNSPATALMTFQDGLISKIELFFDARPFDKK